MILTVVETDAAGATEVSLEAVTFARALARRAGGPVHAVVVGPRPDGLVDQLAGHGVGEVHHATGDAFSAYGGALWAAAVQAAVAAADADAVVAPGSPRGLEVMAHLAARLDVPMAANVVGLGTEDGTADGTDDGTDDGGALRVVRQVLGGAVLEEMLLPRRPAVLTVAGHAVQAEQVPPVPVTLRDYTPEVAEADLVTRVVSTEPAAPDLSGALTSAKVVVGAGRGAGGAEGFTAVAELAELLGGALGVSRVVTSMGWRPHHEQIGQTGSRISPDLYIACGISGAIQHWAGCASSKTILAVNTDENAPMVTKATYAVIGDMHEVVPAVNAEIRRRRG
ncbi:electron transfer flavoprotein subunit alpha/FixB family protein [Pseudonocardia yuanmonensis]|uniref:Electron transfer flavoprotein subunit alpha/FixB family protein n=1 Tax=Pseudonocardia yuanmonensis TaxID=1095914 RepID=A0ABP8XM59_9PSEU